jgi:ribonuclease D
MPLSDLILVDNPAELERALSSLADLGEVGVDVERADWDRYYRAAALIQIGGGGRVVVIDPMALTDLAALAAYLQDRVSVFHAIENDLEPLLSLGVKPGEMRDTAVAAAVLGLPTGLEGLLRDLLDVELSGDKAAMQRANWEARPLTPEMLDYAAGDVADLPELWDELAGRLERSGRQEWYEQELAAVLALPPVEDRRKWSRTKGAGRLDRLARGRLRALWEAREELGRDTDTAPGRIATDAVLVDLAENPPAAVGELGRRGLRRQAVREFGGALISALRGAADTDTAEPRSVGRSPTDTDRQLIEELRQVRAARAKKLGIEAGVLCPSRILAPAVLCDPATPDDLREALGLRPWQWEQLGAAFCAAAGLDGPGIPPEPEDPPAPPPEEPDDR